jgi:uncharacterized protein (DUF58 family)
MAAAKASRVPLASLGGRAFGTVTPTGRGVLAAAAVLGVAAGALHFPELGVLAVGCVAALLCGAALVARQPRLAVDIAVVPARVPRGEPAIASITIHNVGTHASGPLRLQLQHGQRPPGPAGEPTGSAGGPGPAEADVRSLPAAGRRTIAVPLPTGRRGVLRVGPVGLRTTDPFGLFSRFRQLGGETLVHVHPAAHPLAPLPSARAGSPDGLPVDSKSDDGVTFHALREYVPGDDPRRLHWRSSARAGTLLVRRQVDPSAAVTTVLLDTRRRAYPAGEAGVAAFDAAVDAAASVLLASARLRFPVRLRTTAGLRLACAGGRSDDLVVLDALAGVERDADDAGPARRLPEAPADPLTVALRGLARRGIGTLALVTGGEEAGQVMAAGSVVRAFERVIVVRVGRAGEVTSAGGGRLRVLDIVDAAGLREVWPAPPGTVARSER